MSVMKKIFTVCLIALVFVAYKAEACTLFAANGDIVEGGGSLIGKTNDFSGGFKQEVIKDTKHGHPFYALLISLSDGTPRGICGVNQHGLAIVISQASHVKYEDLRKMPGAMNGPAFLAKCKSVEEALGHPEFMTKPVNFILADAKEIAYVEVGTNGKWHAHRRTNGGFSHTNHYLDQELQAEQKGKVYKNSVERFIAIKSLMVETPKPLNIENFKNFAQDNRIFLRKTKPADMETISTMAVDIRPDGDFSVYFTYKPNNLYTGEYKIVEMKKSEIF